MIEDYYADDFIPLQKVDGAEGLQGDSGSYSEVTGADYKGRIRMLNANERRTDNVETMSATHKHWYPVTVDLSRYNKVRCLSGEWSNKDFDVLPIDNVHGHHKKAELRIIE